MASPCEYYITRSRSNITAEYILLYNTHRNRSVSVGGEENTVYIFCVNSERATLSQYQHLISVPMNIASKYLCRIHGLSSTHALISVEVKPGKQFVMFGDNVQTKPKVSGGGMCKWVCHGRVNPAKVNLATRNLDLVKP